MVYFFWVDVTTHNSSFGQQKDGAELKSYLAVLHKMTSNYVPILNLKGTTIVLLFVIKGFQVRRIQSNP